MSPQKLGALVLLKVIFGFASGARGQQANFWISVAGDGSASFPTTLTGNFATKLTTTDGCINPSCLTCYERDAIPGNGTLALTATPGYQYVVRGFYSAGSQVQKVTVYHGFDMPVDVAPTTPQGDVAVSVADTSQYTAVMTFGAGSSDPSTVQGACASPTTSTTTLPSRCTDPPFPVDCGTMCCPVGATCNTLNSQLCCAPGESVSCRGRCCPTGYKCGLDDVSCGCDGSGDRIGFFHGDVTVNGALPVCGQTLQPGDVIEVAAGGSATITFPGSLTDPPIDCSLTGVGQSASVVFRPQSNLFERIFKLIRGLLSVDGKGRHSVEALNTYIGTQGTKFSVDADPDTQTDTIAVTEDAVQVTPKNPALPPFMLNAGQQVDVGPDTVGTITLLCLPGQCDDGDVCTVDTCAPSGCHHDVASGLSGVCSDCDGGIKSPSCAGQPVPAMVAKRFTRACSLEAQVGTSKPSKAKKLKTQVATDLRKANALVKKAAKRRKGALSAQCAGVIAGVLQGTF